MSFYLPLISPNSYTVDQLSWNTKMFPESEWSTEIVSSIRETAASATGFHNFFQKEHKQSVFFQVNKVQNTTPTPRGWTTKSWNLGIQKKVLLGLIFDANNIEQKVRRQNKRRFRHGELNPGLLGPSCVERNTVWEREILATRPYRIDEKWLSISDYNLQSRRETQPGFLAVQLVGKTCLWPCSPWDLISQMGCLGLFSTVFLSQEHSSETHRYTESTLSSYSSSETLNQTTEQHGKFDVGIWKDVPGFGQANPRHAISTTNPVSRCLTLVDEKCWHFVLSMGTMFSSSSQTV
jgi:hypothetical protein